MHPHGEEAVICTTGAITLWQDFSSIVQQEATTDEPMLRQVVLKTGEYAINPKGVWHTADCTEPCTAIFITPGMGTQNKPRKEKVVRDEL